MQSVQSKRDSASPVRTDAALIRTRNNRMPPSYPNLRTASTRIKQSQSADRGWEVWGVGRRKKGWGVGEAVVSGGVRLDYWSKHQMAFYPIFSFVLAVLSRAIVVRSPCPHHMSTSPCPHHRVTGWRKLSKDAVYRGKGAQ